MVDQEQESIPVENMDDNSTKKLNGKSKKDKL